MPRLSSTVIAGAALLLLAAGAGFAGGFAAGRQSAPGTVVPDVVVLVTAQPTYTPSVTPTPSRTRAPFTWSATPGPSPTHRPTSPPPTSTRTPTATWTPTVWPTWTATAAATAMRGPSPTPIAVERAWLSDDDIVQIVYFGHVAPYDDDVVSSLPKQRERVSEFFGELERQDLDVDGDGDLDVVVSSENGDKWNSFAFVLVIGQTGRRWQEWSYSASVGRACVDSRATFRDGMVVADFVSCGSGSGFLPIDWTQNWILCRDGQCATVWSGLVLYTLRTYASSVARDYIVAQFEWLDATTFQVVTRQFSVRGLPDPNWLLHYEEKHEPPPSSVGAAWESGPDTVDTYRWNGSVYGLDRHVELRPAWRTGSESDAMTAETRSLVSASLEKTLYPGYGGHTYDLYRQVWSNLWGSPPEGNQPGQLAAAAHDGTPDLLGPHVAGLVETSRLGICLLNAYAYDNGAFNPLGQAKFYCVADFTHMLWTDLTGDGQAELAVKTIPPDAGSVETPAGLQRVYVYSTDAGLVELARIDGVLNGQDGAGIRLVDVDGDGHVEILAGLPLIDLEQRVVPDTADRRFQVYRWNATTRQFVAGDVWTEPGGGRR